MATSPGLINTGFGSAGAFGSAPCPTPNRRTSLLLDTYRCTSARPSFLMRRTGDEIGRGLWASQRTLQSDAERPSVLMVPGGAWILNPLGPGTAGFTMTGYGAGTVPFPTAPENRAPGFKITQMHRIPSMVGVAPSPGMAPSAPAYRKTVPHGNDGDGRPVNGNWSAGTLPADFAAFASPPLPADQLIPVDRVLHFERTFPENAAFAILLNLTGPFHGFDSFFTFMFGGLPVLSGDSTTAGGRFALRLFGNGAAQLWEQSGVPVVADPASWVKRIDFLWSDTDRIFDGAQVITVIPHGRDRMLFTSRITQAASPSSGGTGLVASPFAVASDPTRNLFVDAPEDTGHLHTLSMTGKGQVRIDQRRDLRSPVALLQILYDAAGFLYDAPFRLPLPVPGGTPIRISGNSWQALGTSIGVQLYGASGNTPCPALGGNEFGSIEGEQNYFVGLNFFSDPLHMETPVLFSYAVSHGGFRERLTMAPTEPLRAALEDVSITGPDLTPDHETCSFKMHDYLLDAPQLTFRDRIPAEVVVRWRDTSEILFKLFQGETLRPEAELKGKPGIGAIANWPPLQYRTYDPLRLVGGWARLADKIHLARPLDFSVDPNGAVDGSGVPLPWKVTDIIRTLLEECMVPEDEIDVPDLDFRLFPTSDGRADVYVLLPGVPIHTYIHELAFLMLGMVLVRDPNCGVIGPSGAKGMWRLLPLVPRANPQNVLQVHSFRHDIADAGGTRLPTASQSWQLATLATPGHTFARRFSTYTKPPEFNHLLVVGGGAALHPFLKGNPAHKLIGAQWKNYKAVNWDDRHPTMDPSHPDFTNGEPVSAIYPALWCPTVDGCIFICKRLADFAGHGETWARWTAPLVPIIDYQDRLAGTTLTRAYPRPLRINDTVYFPDIDRYVLIRSANPIYRHDDYQWLELEGKLYPGPLETFSVLPV